LGEAKKDKKIRPLDLFIILVCLSAAALSLNLFWIDLFRTINSLTSKPVGTVINKQNTVQRQQADRILWDRLSSESTIYSGDLIRVANKSEAVLNVENNHIRLGENTLIRVQTLTGLPEIEFFSGKLSFDGDPQNKGVVLIVAGEKVNVGPGTAYFAEEGLAPRQIAYEGAVTNAPGPVLFRPAADSVFYYQTKPPDLRFQWAGVDGASYYILEAAETPDFINPQIEMQVWNTSIVISSLGTGTWFWRVRPVFLFGYDGSASFSSVASFHIIQNDIMEALSLNTPPPGGTVNINEGRISLYFSWENKSEAAFYTIQVSADQDLSNPVINRTLRENYYAYGKNESSLKPGQYFWHVFFTNDNGILSPPSSVRSFTVLAEEPVLRQVFPPDNYTIATVLLPDILFTWKSNLTFEGRFQVSPRSDFSELEIDEQVYGNSFQGCSLSSGNWYWRVFPEKTSATQPEIPAPSRRFNLIHSLPAPALELPPSGGKVRARANIPVVFSWKPVGGAEYYRFCLYTMADRKNPVYERSFISDTRQTVLMDTLEEGVYYWSIQAFAPETSTATRQTGTLSTEQFTLQNTRPPLILESPAAGTILPGLTAVRQQTVFRWDFPEEVRKSRFVLSTNPDPFRGRPAVDIRNPEQTLNLNRLGEGIWYWSVEVETLDGYTIAGTPSQLRVLPIPLLPATRNRQPSGEHNVGVEELRQRRIVFSWSAVNEANAYILTILHETDNGRRQIVRTNPMDQTRWILDDLSNMDNGAFVWQVEAVNRNRDGVIEQRGQIAENTFHVDVPIPQIKTENPGVFYSLTSDGGGGGESRSANRLTWSGDGYALRYEVVVEREEKGVYQELLRKFTEAFFIETSLPPGNYRYSVTPYDLLNRPSERPEWMAFRVRSTLNPELTDFSPVLIYLNKQAELVLNVFGSNLTAETNIYLRNPNSFSDFIFPVEMSILDNGDQALLHFHSSQFVPGTYDIHIMNPGGVETSMGSLTVLDHEPVVNTAPARQNNFFLRMQEAMNKLFRGKQKPNNEE